MIDITVKNIDDKTCILVSDNGIGIDLDQYGEQVFGLYKRFHPGQEGRGLGLYMCKTQVEALGGNITIESKPGQGTTFKIIL
jgi:signal transduction histidine kinase